MELITATDVTTIVTAFLAPVTDNFVAILLLVATFAGVYRVYKWVRGGIK